MFDVFFSKLWRRLFSRPYRLAAPINEGRGQTVVLLHGIASNHRNWGYVLPHIKSKSRVIALDLLGFGNSPSPEDSNYSVKEHAEAVIYTLKKLRVKTPVILVGHSMGALISVEIAKQRPTLVKRLILCGMPVYRADASKRLLPRQDSMYLRIYNEMIVRRAFTLKAFESARKLLKNSLGFGLEEKQWNAFEKSLTNTIIHQTTYDDIQKLKMPVRIIAGRLDVFVIGRHLRDIAGLVPGSALTMLNEPHEVGEKYSRYIAEEIDAAVEGREVDKESSNMILRVKKLRNEKKGSAEVVEVDKYKH